MAEAADARVFISYARVDLSEAEFMRDSLSATGVEAYLDVHDIGPAEEWRKRLAGLIASADKVLFLISPDSVASPICDWEVNRAERLGKQLVPVVIHETPLEDIPERLTRFNFIFHRTQEERASSLQEIETALRIDLAWEREKSEIARLAERWDASGRRHSLLLANEDAIGTAESWRDRWPPTSVPPTELQLAFISTSRLRSTRRQRVLSGIAVVVAMITVGLAITATIFGQEAQKQRQVAERQTVIAQENEELAKKRAVSAARTSIESQTRQALSQIKAQDTISSARTLLAAWRNLQENEIIDQEWRARQSVRIEKILQRVDSHLYGLGEILEKVDKNSIINWNEQSFLNESGRLIKVAPWPTEKFAYLESITSFVLISRVGQLMIWSREENASIFENHLGINSLCGFYPSKDRQELVIIGAHQGPSMGASSNIYELIPNDLEAIRAKMVDIAAGGEADWRGADHASDRRGFITYDRRSWSSEVDASLLEKISTEADCFLLSPSSIPAPNIEIDRVDKSPALLRFPDQSADKRPSPFKVAKNDSWTEVKKDDWSNTNLPIHCLVENVLHAKDRLPSSASASYRRVICDADLGENEKGEIEAQYWGEVAIDSGGEIKIIHFRSIDFTNFWFAQAACFSTDVSDAFDCFVWGANNNEGSVLFGSGLIERHSEGGIIDIITTSTGNLGYLPFRRKGASSEYAQIEVNPPINDGENLGSDISDDDGHVLIVQPDRILEFARVNRVFRQENVYAPPSGWVFERARFVGEARIIAALAEAGLKKHGVAIQLYDRSKQILSWRWESELDDPRNDPYETLPIALFSSDDGAQIGYLKGDQLIVLESSEGVALAQVALASVQTDPLKLATATHFLSECEATCIRVGEATYSLFTDLQPEELVARLTEKVSPPRQ